MAAAAPIYCLAQGGEPPVLETLGPIKDKNVSHLALHGNATVLNQPTRAGLNLPDDSFAAWRTQQPLTSDFGTMAMWVTPLWSDGNQHSHVFATFNWSGPDSSYFALSQGWWEPVGQRKLYVVVSNRELQFCYPPWEFEYTFFLPGQRTMIAATWKAGTPGYVRLYVDGRRICERISPFKGGRHSLSPVYLGSDNGADAEARGRPSNFVIDDVVTSAWPYSDEEIRRAYLQGGGDDRSKWMLAIASNEPQLDVTHERRMMLDEDTHWASSKLEIQRRLDRVAAAGFNIYAPCVWNGSHATFLAKDAPIVPGLDPSNPETDPLRYLIAQAHRRGIAVHPWFYVAMRLGTGFPESFTAGAPDAAFNVQAKPFRDFIVALVLDVAKRYDVDGINLDYVRSNGVCSSESCRTDYAQKYRRSLADDWKLAESGQNVPSLMEWNRRAIEDIVGRISAEARRLKPKAVITIDTVPFDHSRQHQGMDERKWLREGWVDALVNMAYDDPVDIVGVDRATEAITARHELVAVRNYDLVDRSGVVMADYVRLIRTRWPGAGIAVYHYPHMTADQMAGLKREVFSQAATAVWTH